MSALGKLIQGCSWLWPAVQEEHTSLVNYAEADFVRQLVDFLRRLVLMPVLRVGPPDIRLLPGVSAPLKHELLSTLTRTA